MAVEFEFDIAVEFVEAFVAAEFRLPRAEKPAECWLGSGRCINVCPRAMNRSHVRSGVRAGYGGRRGGSCRGRRALCETVGEHVDRDAVERECDVPAARVWRERGLDRVLDGVE